jgi:hypothetical protein
MAERTAAHRRFGPLHAQYIAALAGLDLKASAASRYAPVIELVEVVLGGKSLLVRSPPEWVAELWG